MARLLKAGSYNLIDNLVYELYQLTEEEIKFIDSQ